tara:strand:- start:1035 stop:1283 length:249 start_codon:yes stop_codon:yes gene_type:complete
MKEQEIKDLGFEIQRETIESSGSDTDWYYYTLDIGDICLITNSNDEVVKDEWEVSIFDFSSCVIKNIDDLKALVSIIKNNQQ